VDSQAASSAMAAKAERALSFMGGWFLSVSVWARCAAFNPGVRLVRENASGQEKAYADGETVT
jgi:hypothetical protein